MKKQFKFISVCIVLGIIILVTICFYRKINKSYTQIIDMNWSIELPNSYEEIYYIDSGASFHGDGERYAIFRYTEESEIKQSVNWENNKNTSIEMETGKILSMLNVSNENMPDFQKNYKYYTKVKQDASKIYLILFPDTKKLYVFEDLY